MSGMNFNTISKTWEALDIVQKEYLLPIIDFAKSLNWSTARVSLAVVFHPGCVGRGLDLDSRVRPAPAASGNFGFFKQLICRNSEKWTRTNQFFFFQNPYIFQPKR